MRILEAKKPYHFEVKQEDNDAALRCDKNNCAIAQAVKREMYGKIIGVEIGSAIALVIYPGKIVRYSMPKNLRAGLLNFDETGQWSLKPGIYSLLPVSNHHQRNVQTVQYKKKQKEYDANRIDKDRHLTRKIMRKLSVNPRTLAFNEKMKSCSL